MSAALLILPDLAPDEGGRPSLDEELLALLRGDTCECLVCGARVDVEGRGQAERIECTACGSVIERPPPPRPGPGQLSFL
jgi:hypothetical protein